MATISFQNDGLKNLTMKRYDLKNLAMKRRQEGCEQPEILNIELRATNEEGRWSNDWVCWMSLITFSLLVRFIGHLIEMTLGRDEFSRWGEVDLVSVIICLHMQFSYRVSTDP